MAKRRSPIERIDVSPARVHTLLTHVQPKLTAEEYCEVKALIETLVSLAELVAHTTASIARVRALLFGAGTEKTRNVLARAGLTPTPSRAADPDAPIDSAGGQPPPAESRRGHGRNGAAAYTGGQRITIAHPDLKAGDRCPACDQGKVYVQREPTVLVRFVGQVPPSRFGTQKVVITPDSQITTKIVALAWTRQLNLSDFDNARLLEFYKRWVDAGPELTP